MVGNVLPVTVLRTLIMDRRLARGCWMHTYNQKLDFGLSARCIFGVVASALNIK